MDYITWDILRGQLWEWITLPTISSQARVGMDYITYAFLTSQLWEWVTFLRTSSQASCGNELYYVEHLNKRGEGMDYIT
jgi:hypothetical protein